MWGVTASGSNCLGFYIRIPGWLQGIGQHLISYRATFDQIKFDKRNLLKNEGQKQIKQISHSK